MFSCSLPIILQDLISDYLWNSLLYYWNFEYHWENKTVMNTGATTHELSSTLAWKTLLCARSAVIPDPIAKKSRIDCSFWVLELRPHLFQQGLCNPFYEYTPKIGTIRCTIPQILLKDFLLLVTYIWTCLWPSIQSQRLGSIKVQSHQLLKKGLKEF